MAESGDEIPPEIVNPFVRCDDLFEFETKDALINIEHPVEDFLEGEIRTQRFLIDGVFLLVKLVAVVPPVPHHDFGVRIIGVGSLQFL